MAPYLKKAWNDEKVFFSKFQAETSLFLQMKKQVFLSTQVRPPAKQKTRALIQSPAFTEP